MNMILREQGQVCEKGRIAYNYIFKESFDMAILCIAQSDL